MGRRAICAMSSRQSLPCPLPLLPAHPIRSLEGCLLVTCHLTARVNTLPAPFEGKPSPVWSMTRRRSELPLFPHRLDGTSQQWQGDRI